MKTPTDYFGNEFRPGDAIAFSTSRGNMSHGIVDSIIPPEGQSPAQLRVEKLGYSYGSKVWVNQASKFSILTQTGRTINLSRVSEFGVLDSIANAKRSLGYDV